MNQQRVDGNDATRPDVHTPDRSGDELDDLSPQRARTTPQDAKENAKEEAAAALRGGIALGHLEITRAVLTTLSVPQSWVGLRIKFFLELMARGLILGTEFLLGRTLGNCPISAALEVVRGGRGTPFH